MDGDDLCSISAAARRTGLTIKAIRFYADRGIVAPTDRDPAGRRRYDDAAVARLALLKTLRDLGIDLPTSRRVLQRELTLAEVAATHAEALATQIRTLRLRRAVLTAVAERGATPEEMTLMHELAKLSAAERGNLVEDFLAAAFAEVAADPRFEGIRRSLTPELPENPTTEQVAAWVELAELTRDEDFRTTVGEMAAHQAGDRPGLRKDPTAIVAAEVAPALSANVSPTAAEATRIVTAVVTEHARLTADPDDAAMRRRLLTRLTTANDPRRERYLELLAVINGWPPPQPLTPALTWFTAALSSRIPA